MCIEISVSPKKVFLYTLPRFVPFIKSSILFFALYPNAKPEFTLVFCTLKCLPIVSLIGFVLSQQLQQTNPNRRQSTSVSTIDNSDTLSSTGVNHCSNCPHRKTQSSINRVLGDISSPVQLILDGLFSIYHRLDWRQLKFASSNYSRLICLGLVFSLFGDILMIAPSTLVWGMLSFGLAHVCYIAAFGLRPLRIELGIFLYLMGGMVFFLIHWPYMQDQPDMAVYSAIYLIVILSMLWRVMVWGLLPLGRPSAWNGLAALIGAFLFLSSDLLISLELFVGHFVLYSDFIIMLTYYSAQFFISLSTASEAASDLRSPFLCGESEPSSSFVSASDRPAHQHQQQPLKQQ